MSALAEALLAAQRQAVAGASKAFVAGTIDAERLAADLDLIGLRDEVDQGLLIDALLTVKALGGEAPQPTGQAAPKMPEKPSDAQTKYIAKLCQEKNLPEPDHIATKDEASAIIEALKAGTYNADAYSVPF